MTNRRWQVMGSGEAGASPNTVQLKRKGDRGAKWLDERVWGGNEWGKVSDGVREAGVNPAATIWGVDCVEHG